MSAATKLPTLLTAQWSTIADPMPTLAAPLQPDDTTAYFSSPLYDGTGTKATGGFHFAIKNSAGYTMTCYVAAGGVAADGLSATIVQGIDTEGLDYSTSNTDLIPDEGFSAGDAISCNIPGVLGSLLQAVIKGNIATGGTGFTLGTEAGDGAEIITLYRTTTAGAKKGFLRWHTGGKTQYSNDGTNWVNIDSVSASNLVSVSATDTTPDYLNSKIDVATAGRLTKTIGSPAGDEKLQLTLATTLTDAEMNAIHAGISANVTGTNLATLTAGAASNADALHTHSSPTMTMTAYEAITAKDAVALLPITVQWHNQLTDVALSIGNTNATRGYAIKIIPSVTSSTLTTMAFRAAEAVNGATNGNLDISIQTDNAGSPSGTIITNGSANQITQATIRTWNTTLATRTATWAASPTLTAGTTYWIVFKMDFTDAANYVKLGENSTYDENYLTFTRQTFDSSGGTWGSSVTNATPFFWFANQPAILGMALCKCDADWGGRTWAFVGFAKANISANASGSIYYDNIPDFTGLTPGADYYLSSTAGGVSTTYAANEYTEGTAPTVFYHKVGKAINTTTLKIQPGIKRIVLREKDIINATTTRQYIYWFKADIVRVFMSQIASNGTGNNDSTSSAGYGLDSSSGSANQMATGMSYNYGANGTQNGSNGSDILMTTGVGRGFTGNASSLTPAGITQSYSMTNNGQVKGFIEVEAY